MWQAPIGETATLCSLLPSDLGWRLGSLLSRRHCLILRGELLFHLERNRVGVHFVCGGGIVENRFPTESLSFAFLMPCCRATTERRFSSSKDARRSATKSRSRFIRRTGTAAPMAARVAGDAKWKADQEKQLLPRLFGVLVDGGNGASGVDAAHG